MIRRRSNLTKEKKDGTLVLLSQVDYEGEQPSLLSNPATNIQGNDGFVRSMTSYKLKCCTRGRFERKCLKSRLGGGTR